MAFNKRKTVGIFSRESDETYKWLIDELLRLKDVKDVRPVYISNRLEHLKKHTEQCDFAIVYHSKNRGRVNVTDMTDSLYHKELEYLFTSLGMRNVLVVIDDLDDSDYAAKCRILEQQPSISKWAWDLILINKAEKSERDKMTAKLDEIERIITRGNQTPRHNEPPKYPGDKIDSPKSSRECCNKRTVIMIIMIVILLVLLIILALLIWKHEIFFPSENHSDNMTSNTTKP